MKQRNYHYLVYFLLTIFWGAIIYYFSSIPDLKSGFDHFLDLIFRKAGHIFVYAILSYLLAKTFDKDQTFYLFFVFLICTFYAITDEVHQLAIVQRSGNPRDVLIDALGVVLGIVLFKFFQEKK